MGSNPVQAWIFSDLIFTTAQVVCITARITFIHVFTRSSNIRLSDILSLLKEDIITMKVEDTKKNYFTCFPPYATLLNAIDS